MILNKICVRNRKNIVFREIIEYINVLYYTFNQKVGRLTKNLVSINVLENHLIIIYYKRLQQHRASLMFRRYVYDCRQGQ